MKLVKTKLDGREFWYREDDRYIGQRIALEKYEPYLTKLILENIDINSMAVDVGANIGYYTVLLANKIKNVWAVEPEEKTFEILTKNCEELKNVNLIKAAAGSKDGVTELEVSKENYGNHRIISNFKFQISKTEKVKIKKLGSLVKEQVDLMKIDVQGWESEVIKGAKELIKKYKPTIFFELSKKENYDKDKKMWIFLKNIYKNIYFIDEYIQIYYPVSFEWVKKYVEKKEQGNLVVFRENNLETKWGGIKDFWPKKWIKRIIGRLET
ncbi:MAG: FkbM family methyltransferase [Candidatus Shapirobacteria bacterium]